MLSANEHPKQYIDVPLVIHDWGSVLGFDSANWPKAATDVFRGFRSTVSRQTWSRLAQHWLTGSERSE